MGRFVLSRPAQWTLLVWLGRAGCTLAAEQIHHSPRDGARVDLRLGQVLAVTLQAQPAAA